MVRGSASEFRFKLPYDLIIKQVANITYKLYNVIKGRY